MFGIKIFHSLDEALAAGFIVVERTSEGYLVRRTTENRFELAIVKIRERETQRSN